MMDMAKKVFAGGEILREKAGNETVYRADIRGETADRILALFIGGAVAMYIEHKQGFK